MMLKTSNSCGPCWSALLGALVFALLAGPVQAGGDNDPVGDLPKSGTGFESENANTTEDSTAGTDEPGVSEGELVEADDIRSATLRVSVNGSLQQVTPVGGLPIQATLDPTADASLLLPEDVVMAEGFLVLDEAAQADLGALLSGATQAQAVVRTGVTAEFDLDRFARLATQHLPGGWSATWVVVSVDSEGVTHMAAAGDLTEVVID